MGLLDSKESLLTARKKILANLNEASDFIQDLSTLLGATDPLPGYIVAYGAEQV